MARYRKEEKKEVPALNMSSMSDIIFMFLFFFMVITTMRESELFVRTSMPAATAIQKLEKKSLVANIYIGPPHDKRLGTEPRIQLDDKISNVRDVIGFVEEEKQKRGELGNAVTWSLKVDQSVKMGIVTDVKQEMRKASAFKVNYAAIKEYKR
ncbi:MAG: biopolymer transporter ExbD [Lentimicrobiaceae bacterium]|nr:biopolymer transporter ExbD [Lentimicrobiaceae bacterium]